MTGRIIILVVAFVVMVIGLILLRSSSRKIPVSSGPQKNLAFGDQPPLIDSLDAPMNPNVRVQQKPVPGPQRKPAQSDRQARGRALYDKNCYVCHGQRGEGDGPGAMVLDERPRNFRMEPFKYVSTWDGKPTREDLARTIRDGRILGRMPAFRHLDADQINVLIDYILEIRRQGIEEKLTQAAKKNVNASLTPKKIARLAREKASCGEEIGWTRPPEGFKPDPVCGANLFEGRCAPCHGASGRGDGNARPKDEQGAPIKVRDLTSGRFQGGHSPKEIFWRTRCGIPGTPMPAQTDFQDDDIWELVYYVKSMVEKKRKEGE